MSYATNTINYDDLVNNAISNRFDNVVTTSSNTYTNTVPSYNNLNTTTPVSYGGLNTGLNTGINSSQTALNTNFAATSRITEQVLNAKTPFPVNETALQTVRINGTEITGIWVNRDECLNWRGPIPLDQYRINTDSATVIRKQATHSYDATQNISVRYLKPPPLQAPGDLIIREEGNVQLPAAPPIIIRQQAAAVRATAPLIYREKPPRPPAPVPTQTITIPGRAVDPPPRQVIVERMAAAAQAPQDIIIERWLGYQKQRRNVVHQRSQSTVSSAAAAKNVIIDWETTGRAENVNQKYNFLGVETADPNDYERRYGSELVETNRLPPFVNELNSKIPTGEVLASNVTQTEFILTGDVDALKLVDKNKNLNDYLSHRF
jgi:hypothetical protein